MNLQARLSRIEERLTRLELLSYLAYDEIRRVADYAYQNDLAVAEYAADVDAEDVEPLERMPSMRVLADHDALVAGMSLDQLVALKSRAQDLGAVCRQEAVTLAKQVADLMIAAQEVPVAAEEERAA